MSLWCNFMPSNSFNSWWEVEVCKPNPNPKLCEPEAENRIGSGEECGWHPAATSTQSINGYSAAGGVIHDQALASRNVRSRQCDGAAFTYGRLELPLSLPVTHLSVNPARCNLSFWKRASIHHGDARILCPHHRSSLRLVLIYSLIQRWHGLTPSRHFWTALQSSVYARLRMVPRWNSKIQRFCYTSWVKANVKCFAHLIS